MCPGSLIDKKPAAAAAAIDAAFVKRICESERSCESVYALVCLPDRMTGWRAEFYTQNSTAAAAAAVAIDRCYIGTVLDSGELT